MNKQSYTIRLVLQTAEMVVLKKALESYPKQKDITTDLLGLIKYQEEKQNENT
jgi:hypothetical protein